MSAQKKNQELKKYIIFGIMFLVFAGCMWLIFAPSESDKKTELQGIGFNEEIPSATNGEMYGDKRDAYEQDKMNSRREDNVIALDGYSTMLANKQQEAEQVDLVEDYSGSKPAPTVAKQSPIHNSVSSYQDINRTLGNFYTQPKDDPEKIEMKKKLEELEARLNEKESKQSVMDEQVALMEKSYQLAAKYMPQNGTDVQYASSQPSGLSAEDMKNKILKSPAKSSGDKVSVSVVRQVKDRTVSSLRQNLSDDELLYQYDQPRNMGFNSLKNVEEEIEKNTIKACVHGDQTIMDGQSVFLRLLEPIQVENGVVHKNTVLTGQAKLQGERLNISISSIEFEGAIFPVKLTIYDLDGTKGIYVPSSMELDALKEIAASAGNSVGTSFTMTQSTSEQIASDLSKGLIQGVSQYFTKKIRAIKINLKAGHNLLLSPDKQ
ncbi:conjugative transposon protein TraM [Dysgonomonas sp. ZJ709]|uniref:conjugative transposon protein TraM n=1 Tax=Dysgonomonas sp. ZJ709 TaxID=2709797 RepID=UPI0013EE0724|nr:conjugative transposon protein TraM [Dysgonomonas sp. ZJ709]